ncbi:MAG: adenine phosphoribosyltransferase [Candidatus Obscuribacterales bacterium]|nr:adenine phosphoribosyltransferase [Candidatus Obscuribacterales bacterium]
MAVETERSKGNIVEKKDLELPLKADRDAWLKSKVRDIPDFPKPGIIFKDLTTLMKDAEAMNFSLLALAEKTKTLNPDVIAGIEARGFILAPAIAHILSLGFIPIRKPKKLPYKVEKVSYELEYGTDSLEIHVDAIEKGEKVVLIDDLLATGGTARAAHELLSKIGGNVVGTGFLVELGFLSGRAKLRSDCEIFSLIKYE